MPGYTRMPKGSAGGHNAASFLWLPRTVRLYCLGANERCPEISRKIGVLADQVAGGQDVRRPPESRAEWCNTALLIYRENK